MNFAIRLLIKSAVLGLALPALGLITFSGGFLMSIIATLLVGAVGTVTTLTFLGPIARESFVATMFGAVVGGKAGAYVSSFLFETVMYGLFMWITAMIFPGVFGLVGIGATLIAAAILSATSNVISAVEQA